MAAAAAFIWGDVGVWKGARCSTAVGFWRISPRSSRPQPCIEYQCLWPTVKRMCYNVIVCGSDPQTSLRELLRSATSTPKSFSQVFCHTGSCHITSGSCTYCRFIELTLDDGIQQWDSVCVYARQTAPIGTIAVCMQKQHNKLWCLDLNKTCLALCTGTGRNDDYGVAPLTTS